MILKLIEWLFLFLAVAFPFGQFTRIPLTFFGLEETRLYLIDLIVFFIVFFWFIWHHLTKRKIILPPLCQSLLFFLIALFFSWIVNLSKFSFLESIVGFLYLFRYSIYASLYFVIWDLKESHLIINRDIVFKYFCFWCIIFATFGIIQYLFVPDTRFLLFSGWDEHYYRVVGTFFDPNFMGIIFVFGILNALAFLLAKIVKGENKAKRNERLLLGLTFLTVIPFLLTYSRSSYLALVAGVIVLIYLNKKLKFFLFFIFTFLFFILLLPRPGGEGVRLERVTSALQRVESWQVAINIWQKNPFFGVGFNNYRYALKNAGFLSGNDWRESHAAAGVDNSMLFVLTTSGIVGFAFFVNFWGRVFLLSYKEKDLFRKGAVLSCLVALLIHSLFLNSFFYLWVIVWFWFLVSLIG